ncbi:MAG: fluoride efflux transporter CrcB [Vulcanimicrobiaceae bacterium]
MLDARVLAAVFLGGGLGSVLRYLVTFAVTQRVGPGLPWATFIINITGSFAIGIISELYITRTFAMTSEMRTFFAVGVLGGYTTFSTFALEALNLAREGAVPLAVSYALASVLLGVAAALLGVAVVRALPA